MKKLLLVLLATLSLTAVAQIEPNWYDNDMRRSFYPAGQYFIGFAEGQRMGNESLEAATSRLKNAARVEALSTIRVHVQNTTINQSLSQTLRTMEGTFRQSAREFSSATQTTVDMEIPGLQIEAWRNPQNGNIAAFAYVKKSTLIRQLEKKITVGLTKIETSMDQIDQLVASGQKLQARELAEKTVPHFKEIDEAQKLLAAVDENADEESLQLQETRTLQHRLIGLVAQLKNGIKIHIACHAFLFESSYPELLSQIKGCLSDLGCEFITNVDNSDWDINVISKPYVLKQVSENSFACRLNTTIRITNRTTGKNVYEARVYNNAGMDVKGNSVISNDDAAIEAYKNLSPIICTTIKDQIMK